MPHFYPEQSLPFGLQVRNNNRRKSHFNYPNQAQMFIFGLRKQEVLVTTIIFMGWKLAQAFALISTMPAKTSIFVSIRTASRNTLLIIFLDNCQKKRITRSSIVKETMSARRFRTVWLQNLLVSKIIPHLIIIKIFLNDDLKALLLENLLTICCRSVVHDEPRFILESSNGLAVAGWSWKLLQQIFIWHVRHGKGNR